MKKYIVLGTLVTLVGCSSYSGKYACSAIPDTDECASLSDVYEYSHDVNDYPDTAQEVEQENKEGNVTINVSPSNKSLDYISPGDPILTKPVVMRVLYRSFENDQQDLDAGGYVYLRMKESEWVIQKEPK